MRFSQVLGGNTLSQKAFASLETQLPINWATDYLIQSQEKVHHGFSDIYLFNSLRFHLLYVLLVLMSIDMEDVLYVQIR